MSDIIIPFRIEDLILKPEMAGRIRLSDDMQQTLAALTGYDGVSRRLLRCSQAGILRTSSPRIRNIVHVTVTDPVFTWQGSDIKVTEVMIMGHPDNTGLVWVKNDEVATANNGWPLGSGDIMSFTLDNLSNLHLYIVTTAEKAIVAYSR